MPAIVGAAMEVPPKKSTTTPIMPAADSATAQNHSFLLAAPTAGFVEPTSAIIRARN